MSTETAQEPAFSPATAEDLPFIRETVERLRLDGEDLRPEQFITLRTDGRIVAFGRVKPYERTAELGCVAVAEEQRGRGLGAAVVRELVRRFPQDEVFVTTDLPEYFERLGFLRTDILPEELEAKIGRVEGVVRSGVVGLVYDRVIERLPTIADVYRARELLRDHIERTPLVYNGTLSRELGCEVYLKLENLLPIGAFKVRGGLYLGATLAKEERERGIIGASTGNHGQSLAYGARQAGVRCVIAVPERSNPVKVESIQALGAQIEVHGAHFEEAREWAEEHARRQGMRYVHHINTPELVAGVATMSLEVVEDLPDVDVIVTPIGGGSGAMGHCLVAKTLRPAVQVIGVQAAGAPAVYECWKQRKLVRAPIDTSAEGLATGQAYYMPVKTFVDRLDDMLLAFEEELRDAIVRLVRSAHVVAEEAGAAATAGAVKLGDALRGKKVAMIVSGGNIPLPRLRDVLAEQ